MPGLVPGIQAFFVAKEGVDGRDKRGHDDYWLRGRSCVTAFFAQPDSRGQVRR
jgi:hypothetical protein